MRKIYSTAGIVLFFGVLWGCGTGEYEDRLDKRISELKTGSKFNVLSSSTEVPGTQVSIRIPQVFKNPPLTEGAQEDGKPVDPRRIKPNPIDIPDLKVTYEGFIEDASKGKQPYYLYIAVSTGPARENFPRITENTLNEKLTNVTNLTDFQAQTPEGRFIDWKRCRATGNQDFYYIQRNGNGQFRKMPGVIEVLFHDENNQLVTIAWRMPSGIEQSLDFKTWINMVAGCVKVSP